MEGEKTHAKTATKLGGDRTNKCKREKGSLRIGES